MKQYKSVNDLPFFNVNAHYCQMDAAAALQLLEKELRSNNGNLSPESYSALTSLAGVIVAQSRKIVKLQGILDAMAS